MKKIYLLYACLLCAVVMSAQTTKIKNQVILTNGIEIIGYVAPQPDGSYVVETEAGDMFYYSGSEIKKIIVLGENKVKVETAKDSKTSNNLPVEYKSKGYMGIVGATLGTAQGVSIINGYRFSPHFYLGFETGIKALYYFDEEPVIPLNLYFMSEFSKKRVAMFADLRAGMLCGFLRKSTYGFEGSLTLGVRNRFRKDPNKAMWYGINFGYLTGISAQISFSF